MFTANAPTRNYRLDAIFYALETAIIGATAPDQGCLFNSYSQTTYGKPYLIGVDGFKILFTTQRIPGGASSYSIDFESPWWSGNLANSPTLILNNSTVTLEFDNVDHMCGCDSWNLDFTELRIYLDGVLAHTVGSTTISGSGYDPRDDDSEVYNQTSPYVGIAWGRPNCGGWVNRITNSYQANLQSHMDGIWDWSDVAAPAWTEDGVSVAGYTPGGLGCLSCGTSVAGPTNLVGGAVTVSKHIRAQTWYQDALVAADLTDITCICLPSTTVNSVWHYWTMQRTLDWLPPITAKFVPDVSPIRKHTWRETENCLSSAGNSTYDSGVVTVTDSNGVSIWNGSRFKGDWKRFCVEMYIGPIPCIVGETRSCTPFDPTNPANIPPDVYCYITVTVVMTWPTKPPCGPTSPWHWQDPKGNLIIATYLLDGDAWCKTAFRDVPAGGWDISSQITTRGDVVSARFARETFTGWIWCMIGTYAAGAYDSYVGYSPDLGATWDIQHYMANAVLPSFEACPNQDWVIAKSEYISGTSGPMYGYVSYHEVGQLSGSNPGFTTVRMQYWDGAAFSDMQFADKGLGNVEMPFSNTRMLTMAAVIDGETDFSVWYSKDKGASWYRVT